MNTLITFLSFLSLATEIVHGIPTFSPEGVAKISEDLRGLVRRKAEKRLLFDPLTSPIEGERAPRPFRMQTLTLIVTGDYSFIPPDFEAGDQRGPCPGLNALANHGYIGRNGVTSVCDAS